MPAERLSMRKVREVLRLKHALGMSYRKISEATGVGKTQAAEYVRRAEAAGIGWQRCLHSAAFHSSKIQQFCESVGIWALLESAKVVAAQQLSLIRSPDAANSVRNAG